MKTPPEVFKMISEFWEWNKDKETDEDWSVGSIFVNYWKNPTKMVQAKQVHESIWETTNDIISEWTGQKLQESSVYGIRVYKEGTIIAPHVDKLPHIGSAIINVAQDVDEPWPLEFIGHDGIARNVTMEPGDMVLYEGHSVIHGECFPFYAIANTRIFHKFMIILK